MFSNRLNFVESVGAAFKVSRRNKSTYLSSKLVRQRFIDFFLKEDHTFLRSSSVKPYNDPTLEFVNAGMNQFKSIFLESAPGPAARATNSQKCIRIGGKHNDLNTVGYDSYHHTFFEMLGNWSFGDYFKRESCEFAWNLLTSEPYSLQPKRLYATYFGGDKSLNLPPDIETKEIWERIGVSRDRILPFGLKDNFWEMGRTGPCGPCTELHYDHLGATARPHCVNASFQDLTELWNIVFIQFNREEDGRLDALQQNYVDTGMGLERLVALLQGKNSNYDTDLFLPLFETISEVTGIKSYEGKFGTEDMNGVDTAYRILADHARMISVAIADNVLPDNSHGLRRVIRKGLLVSEKLMPNAGVDLLIEVAKENANVLYSAYPEISTNMNQIECVLRDENTLWFNLRESVRTDWKKLLTLDPNLAQLNESQSAGLIGACKELHSLGISSGHTVHRKLALNLYDRYGLSQQLIEELMSIKGLKIDMEALARDISALKEMNRASVMASIRPSVSGRNLHIALKNYRPTDDSAKFRFEKTDSGEYLFEPLTARVKAVFCDEKLLKDGDPVNWGSQIGLLLDRTNFWTSTKGDNDIGCINLMRDGEEIAIVEVEDAYNHSGYVIHYGRLLPISESNKIGLTVDDWTADVRIDAERRLALMRNTTASHLVNFALRTKYTSRVQAFNNYHSHFAVSYSTYGQQVTLQDVQEIEKLVNSMLTQGFDIEVSNITVQDLLSSSEIYVPPFVNVQLGNLQLINFTCGETNIKEITVGPNVCHTGDIEKFCFLGFTMGNKNRECILECVSGTENVTAVQDVATRMDSYLEQLPDIILQSGDIESEISKAAEILNAERVPLALKVRLNKHFEEMATSVRDQHKKRLASEMEELLDEARANSKKYVVHFAGENVKLEKLTRLCPDLPVVLFAYNRGSLTARCTVPKDCQLTAEYWINEISKDIGGEGNLLRGHDPKCTFSLKPFKVSRAKLNEILEKVKQSAMSIGGSVLD